MKKYVKPMITLERFELSQNIADCAWELKNSTDINNCSAEPDNNFFFGSMNGNLFTESTANGCTIIAGVQYEDYCYQNGSGSPFKVFKS